MFFYQYFSAGILRNKLLDHLDNQLMLEAHQEALKPNQTPGLKPYRGVAYMPSQPPRAWQREQTQ